MLERAKDFVRRKDPSHISVLGTDFDNHRGWLYAYNHIRQWQGEAKKAVEKLKNPNLKADFIAKESPYLQYMTLWILSRFTLEEKEKILTSKFNSQMDDLVGNLYGDMIIDHFFSKNQARVSYFIDKDTTKYRPEISKYSRALGLKKAFKTIKLENLEDNLMYKYLTEQYGKLVIDINKEERGYISDKDRLERFKINLLNDNTDEAKEAYEALNKNFLDTETNLNKLKPVFNEIQKIIPQKIIEEIKKEGIERRKREYNIFDSGRTRELAKAILSRLNKEDLSKAVLKETNEELRQILLDFLTNLGINFSE